MAKSQQHQNPQESENPAPNGAGSVGVDPAAPKRAHKATYARDKKKGGYLIRVEGPHAGKFAGRTVPATRRDGTETMEELDALLWTGTDDESGKPVALYTFKQRPATKEGPEF